MCILQYVVIWRVAQSLYSQIQTKEYHRGMYVRQLTNKNILGFFLDFRMFLGFVIFLKNCHLCGSFLGKNNKQKSQLNRVRRPERRALMLCEDSRAQQEEKRLFPDKDSVNKKPWTLFTIALSTSISPKVFSLPSCSSTWTQLTKSTDPMLQFSADPK